MIEIASQANRQILQRILDQIERTPLSDSFVLLTSDEIEQMKTARLLTVYEGFRPPLNLSREEEMEALRAHDLELINQGKRILIPEEDPSDFFIVETAALKELVETLSGAEAVSAKEKKHTEHHKPQEQTQKWQGYVAPKYEDTVLVAVRVEEDIRDKFHAVMRAKNTTAQEFLSDYIVQQVNKHPELVEQGEHMDAAGTKKNYRTKLRILKEENARLRSAGHTGKSSRSR